MTCLLTHRYIPSKDQPNKDRISYICILCKKKRTIIREKFWQGYTDADLDEKESLAIVRNKRTAGMIKHGR